MGRADAKTQHDKYVAFKTAVETINHHLNQNNFLAAYVIAFSLIEDRIRAMAVVHYQSKNSGKTPSANYINASFANHVRRLKGAHYLTQEDAALFLDEAKIRNELLHAAMWNLHAFTKESVQQAMSLARLADKHRRAQKRRLKI